MIGRLVATPGLLGEFRPVREIARGGMGVVYEVRSTATGGSFAAKLALRRGPRARARFEREALLHSRCDRHEGVAKLRRFGHTEDGAPYMILELVTGGSLERLLAREGRLEPARAVRIAHALALALGHMHACDIVHRDVKPSNVLVDALGEPKLTDFGLAAARDLESLEAPGVFVGTHRYCSPEQALRGTVGPAADVFSLGCVLFEMLTGERPFEAANQRERLARIARPAPSIVERLVGAGVRTPVAAAVGVALEERPERRPRDGAELARVLALAVGRSAIMTRSASR